MRMSWTRQFSSRRHTLATATGLAAGAVPPLTGAFRTAAAPAQGPARVTAGEYANPLIWQDFADIDIIRVGNTYCTSASTMHNSPGSPVLRSYDPVNWETAGHSAPEPCLGAKHDLNGARGRVAGIRDSPHAARDRDALTRRRPSLRPGRPCGPKAPGATGLSEGREGPGSHTRSAVVLTDRRTPHRTDSPGNL